MRTLAQLNLFSEVESFFENTMEKRDESGINSDPISEAELWYWYGRSKYQAGLFEKAYDAFKKSVEVGEGIDRSGEREVFTLAAYYAGRSSEVLMEHSRALRYYEMASKQEAAPNARKDAERRYKLLR